MDRVTILEANLDDISGGSVDMSGSVGFDCFDPPSWQVDVNLDVNIAGFHGPGDHGDPSPV